MSLIPVPCVRQRRINHGGLRRGPGKMELTRERKVYLDGVPLSSTIKLQTLVWGCSGYSDERASDKIRA